MNGSGSNASRKLRGLAGFQCVEELTPGLLDQALNLFVHGCGYALWDFVTDDLRNPTRWR